MLQLPFAGRIAAKAVLLVAAVAFVQSSAQAGVSTLNVLKRTATVIAVEEEKDNQVLFIQIDHVDAETIKTQTYTLESGLYRIYAIGDDNRILDLDLKVVDSLGRTIGEDTDDSNIAIVDVRLKRGDQLKFKVEAAELKRGIKDGFFSLIVVRID